MPPIRKSKPIASATQIAEGLRSAIKARRKEKKK